MSGGYMIMRPPVPVATSTATGGTTPLGLTSLPTLSNFESNMTNGWWSSQPWSFNPNGYPNEAYHYYDGLLNALRCRQYETDNGLSVVHNASAIASEKAEWRDSGGLGGIQGYRRFSSGLRYDYLENDFGDSDTTITQIRQIRDNPQFSDVNEFQNSLGYSTQCGISREMAYAGIAEIDARKAGEPEQNGATIGSTSGAPTEPQLRWLVPWMVNHLHQWRAQSGSGYWASPASDNKWKPFMWGLTCKTLIKWWEYADATERAAYWKGSSDPVWPGHITLEWDHTGTDSVTGTVWSDLFTVLDEMAEWAHETATQDGTNNGGDGRRMWNDNGYGDGYGWWWYADDGEGNEWGSDTADLNNLITPIYGWVGYQNWLQGDNTRAQQMFDWADNMFGSRHVHNANFGSSSNGGKIWNQNYFWIFEYLDWRAAVG